MTIVKREKKYNQAILDYFKANPGYLDSYSILNEWERGFITSIIAKLKNPNSLLSSKQKTVYERIFKKVEANRIGVPPEGYDEDDMIYDQPH